MSFIYRDNSIYYYQDIYMFLIDKREFNKCDRVEEIYKNYMVLLSLTSFNLTYKIGDRTNN
jgi:hypothetical protein